jgi:hypothetical protein
MVDLGDDVVNAEVKSLLAWITEPRVHLMGKKVGIFCRTGFVEAVQDASYDVTWNEHVGTDWVSIPYPLGNGRWVRDEIYHHHYVQRSKTVGRNKIVVRIDGSDAEANVDKGTDQFWFDKNVEFNPGDRVVVVVAEFDRIILVNETRRFQIFTGRSYSGDPEPDGPLQALGRNLALGSVSFSILLLSLGLAWAASAILPVAACILIPIAFLVVRTIAVGAWNARREVFVRRVRDACESALKRLELVRNGADPKKAHTEAFGDMSGTLAPVARKPWLVGVCEAMGATALPPLGSRQYYEEWYARHLAKEASRGRKPTEEEARIAAEAFDVASREYGKAYVEHRGKVPESVVAAIGQRQEFATRPARPERHSRLKKKKPGVDAEWEIHWGQPKWPAPGEPQYIDYMFKQTGWFNEACRNGTIPPLPPEYNPDGSLRFRTRSIGRDPAFPEAA